MHVLITGASGNLGRALVPALVEAGHTPRLMDFRPLETLHPFIQGDVRSADDVRRAVAGVDAVVHAAALHGIHLRNWVPHDYWAINVTGTFNVYEAAREAGVEQLVLCSTMGVYGASAQPPADAWGVVTEGLPCLPAEIYGVSKRLCEELARDYGRRWGMRTVALRLGMFVPERFERYGFRLLFGGVDDRDVAQAVLRALAYAPPSGFDASISWPMCPSRTRTPTGSSMICWARLSGSIEEFRTSSRRVSSTCPSSFGAARSGGWTKRSGCWTISPATTSTASCGRWRLKTRTTIRMPISPGGASKPHAGRRFGRRTLWWNNIGTH